MRILLLIYLQLFFSSPLPNQADTLKLLFLGDIMQHKAQLDAAHIRGKSASKPESYDYSPYFSGLKEMFDSVDIRIANMETTFGPAPYTGYPAFCSPSPLLSESMKSGIDIFLTANNHICDKGRRGLEMSIALYDTLKAGYLGIYRSQAEMEEKHPMLIVKKGIKIAMLNYTYGVNGNHIPKPYVVNLLDTIQIKKDLNRARDMKPDFIIACVHWGVEYVLTHNANQEKIEKVLQENGTDIIIGSHPHVAQDYTIYQTENGDIRYITFYSLGNAISNMTAPNTRTGLAATILLYKDISGNKKILAPECRTIFTSRPGESGKNFTIIPGKEYQNKNVKRLK